MLLFFFQGCIKPRGVEQCEAMKAVAEEPAKIYNYVHPWLQMNGQCTELLL